MSYQERKTIVSMLTSIITSIFFVIYILNKYPMETLKSSDDFKHWGIIFIILIGIVIVANIFSTIVLNIHYRITTKEEEPSFLDEMDKLITLKADRISHYIFTIGFAVSMILLALGNPVYITFITIAVFGFFAEQISLIYTLLIYRRGF